MLGTKSDSVGGGGGYPTVPMRVRSIDRLRTSEYHSILELSIVSSGAIKERNDSLRGSCLVVSRLSRGVPRGEVSSREEIASADRRDAPRAAWAPSPGALGPARVAASITAGLLLGLTVGIDSHFAASLAVVSLIPWLWALERSTMLGAFALSVLTAVVYGCASSAWVPDALRSLGSTPAEAALGWLIASAWAKSPILVPAGLLFRVLRPASPSGLRPICQCLCFAASLMLAEHAVYRIPHGLPWGLVGHSQISAPGAAQLAILGGVPTITFALAILNVSLYRLLTSPSPESIRFAAAAATGWMALSGLGLGVAQWTRPPAPDGPGSRALLIQPDLPREERQSVHLQAVNLARLHQQTARAMTETDPSPDIVYWPESTLVLHSANRAEMLEQLREVVDQIGTTVVLGVVEHPRSGSDDSSKNFVLKVEPNEGIVARFDKAIPVPLVESNSDPMGQAWLRTLFGHAATHSGQIQPDGSLETRRAGFSNAVVLCFEALFPHSVVAQGDDARAQAIINLADNSWVSSPIAARQLTRFARFRAIEQRLPLLRIAHGGLSVVVDEFGRTVEEVPLAQASYAIAELRRSHPPALPERLAIASLPLGAGVGLWATFVLASVWSRSHRRSPRGAFNEDEAHEYRRPPPRPSRSLS